LSKEFAEYRAKATGFSAQLVDPQGIWQQMFDWYKGGGRELFIEAFSKETGLRVDSKPKLDDIVAAAVPKSYSDLNNKAKDDAFYRAHAHWFLEEMDTIVNRVPRTDGAPGAAHAFADVLRFARPVLLDSVLLFEDWGTFRMGVPGVYGIGKNNVEHLMAFYQGARQTIYGHGSWGLSFADNHADLAAATIRQAVEIRLRRAFGVFGKISKIDGAIQPIPLSDLIEAIDLHKASISFPVRFENIRRINGWANMYLHGALKLYGWSPPRVLAFLQVFLLGGPAPGWPHDSAAGVALEEATLDAVREIIKQKHEDTKFDLELWRTGQCEAFIK
jgi:hypothetical protein